MAAFYSPFPITTSASLTTINTKHSLHPQPLLRFHSFRTLRSGTLYRKTGMNVAVMSSRGSAKETELGASGLPDIVTNVLQTWSNVDDKLALGSLGFALIVGIWTSTGVIYALDQLPVIPEVLELVGLAYSGWFVYTNLIFEPDREALTVKIKSIITDIIGPI